MNSVNLTYHGHSCFVLNFDGYRIALDPFTGVPGYPELSIEANEVLCSHEHGDHNFRSGVRLFSGKRPAGLAIEEIHSFHDPEGGRLRGENCLRIFEYGGLRIMHCGDLGVHPTPEQTAKMMNLDVLLLPVGGFFTMDPKECKAFADEIRTKVIVPMHFRKENCGYDVIGTLDDFLALYGADADKKIVAKEATAEITGTESGRIWTMLPALLSCD